MKPEERERFIEIMDKTALLKGVEITRERADAWFDELIRFDLDVMEKTFVELRRERWGFPELADVFAHAGDLQRDTDWKNYHNSPEQIRERELLAKAGDTGPERIGKILANIKTVGGKG